MKYVGVEELKEKGAFEVEEFKECIESCDMLDLERDPRLQGHWELTDALPHWVCCSECYKRLVPNVLMIKRYDIPLNYCPNCGATMGKEDVISYLDGKNEFDEF